MPPRTPLVGRHCRVEQIHDDLSFVDFAGGHFDVEHYAPKVVDHGMLLVGWLPTTISAARGHAGIWSVVGIF